MSAWGERFARFSSVVGLWTGQPLAFVISVAACIVWAVSGPLFGFSDTWQLVINTGTTVLTFLLVFVIQNTAIRDNAAVHIKLDEILRALPEARTELVLHHLEDASEEELAHFKAELERIARRQPS
jgi:low affinity Fe/Cu permease